MLISFFRQLIFVWVYRAKPTYQAIDEAVRFYLWLIELKTRAHYPDTMASIREKRIALHLKKMPTLTDSFYKALSELESDLKQIIPGVDRDFLAEKESNVRPVCKWLPDAAHPAQLSALKGILTHAEQTSFKLKRNRKTTKA